MDLRGQLVPASRAKPLNLPINASVVAHERVRLVIAAANDAPKGRFRHRFLPSLTATIRAFCSALQWRRRRALVDTFDRLDQ